MTRRLIGLLLVGLALVSTPAPLASAESAAAVDATQGSAIGGPSEEAVATTTRPPSSEESVPPAQVLPDDAPCGLSTSIPEPTQAMLNSAASQAEPAGSASHERLIHIVQKSTSPGVRLGGRPTRHGLQVLGTIDEPGISRVRLGHTTDCIRDAAISFAINSDGGATMSVGGGGGAGYEVGVRPPWAVDAAGNSVSTWYEADGSDLIQIVDASAALAPITFDPSYYIFSCAGHFSDQTAYVYLDMYTSDPGYCSVRGMFQARNNYDPKWGYEANVYNDYGYVAVRTSGECSGPSDDWNIDFPDTGYAWDFQVPCKAHDYCYDLRGAGFSSTVTDGECDDLFWYLMEAHCNNRSFPLNGDCRFWRDIAYNAVRLWFVVTNPDPGVVEVQNLASLKCADVEGPSTADFAPLQQWTCLHLSNQRFRIHPAPGAPGLFQIKATHSNKCIRAFGIIVYQYGCLDTLASLRFRIQGALNGDQYSIRGGDGNYQRCWKVTNTLADGSDLVHPSCIDWDYWYLWRILDA